ncbi:MAG: hypothetical protein ACRD2L_09265, partial [Terriglobia bacterium]
ARVADADHAFRELRDEYKKAELLVGYLELKYRELFALHYDFRDRTRRLSGLSSAANAGSGTERHEDFGTELPFGETEADKIKKKQEETF